MFENNRSAYIDLIQILFLILIFITDKNADVFPCSWGDIPLTLQCDGTNNCGDNSDEENCNKGNIKPFQ